MIAHECFVDTNILVYAHDKTAGEKYHKAKKLINELWFQDFPPNISIQVLQEFYVNLQRIKVPGKVIEQIILDLMNWSVIDNDIQLFIGGIDLKNRFKISLWDAMILAAAQKGKAKYLISEDFTHNRAYDGIIIINPFILHSF
jgi:predicted nucleic acid-binding protein